MKFIEFNIVNFSRPYIEVTLKTINEWYTRGNFYYDTTGPVSVRSSNVFEFGGDILFIHGLNLSKDQEEQITQTINVRDFIKYNAARVVCNKHMEDKRRCDV